MSTQLVPGTDAGWEGEPDFEAPPIRIERIDHRIVVHQAPAGLPSWNAIRASGSRFRLRPWRARAPRSAARRRARIARRTRAGTSRDGPDDPEPEPPLRVIDPAEFRRDVDAWLAVEGTR